MTENTSELFAVNELRVRRTRDTGVLFACSLCGHTSPDWPRELSDAKLLALHRKECPGKPQTNEGEHVVRRIRADDERNPPRRFDVD